MSLQALRKQKHEAKRNIADKLSGAELQFWRRKLVEKRLFYESLSQCSRPRTGARKNRERMLGDERCSSPHIMSCRLLSVRLLVCQVKRQQQKTSALPELRFTTEEGRCQQQKSAAPHICAHTHSTLLFEQICRNKRF